MAALQPGSASKDGVPCPLTQQQHIADNLGLSLLHTNKALRTLEQRDLHRLENGRLHQRDDQRDVKAQERMADLCGDGRPPQSPLG